MNRRRRLRLDTMPRVLSGLEGSKRRKIIDQRQETK